jgi:hypothetical protein
MKDKQNYDRCIRLHPIYREDLVIFLVWQSEVRKTSEKIKY